MMRYLVATLAGIGLAVPLHAQRPAFDSADVQQAITRGLASKQWEGWRGGGSSAMTDGTGFDVYATGPLNRVADAAGEAAKKYLPFTIDSVPSDSVRSVVILTAWPRPPRFLFGTWHRTPAAIRLVLRHKGSTDVIQPSKVFTFPQHWTNAVGGRFTGEGVEAEFPVGSLPAGELQVIIITADDEYHATWKAGDRHLVR